MIKLGEVLDEPAYIEFARKNVAFNFDNYRYCEPHAQATEPHGRCHIRPLVSTQVDTLGR